MIPTVLSKEFASKEFVMTTEVTNMRKCFGKANKLEYIYTPLEGCRVTSVSRNGKLTTSKSKSYRLSYIFVEIVSLFIDNCKCHRLTCDDCRDGVMGTVLMCIFNVN